MHTAKKDDDESGLTKMIVTAFLYAVTIGALTAMGWAGVAIYDLRMEVRLLRQELDDHQSADEVRLKATLRKHWKLHTWTRDQVTEIREHTKMPISHWPDLPE
jgi:hypothetical protein